MMAVTVTLTSGALMAMLDQKTPTNITVQLLATALLPGSTTRLLRLYDGQNSFYRCLCVPGSDLFEQLNSGAFPDCSIVAIDSFQCTTAIIKGAESRVLLIRKMQRIACNAIHVTRKIPLAIKFVRVPNHHSAFFTETGSVLRDIRNISGATIQVEVPTPLTDSSARFLRIVGEITAVRKAEDRVTAWLASFEKSANLIVAGNNTSVAAVSPSPNKTCSVDIPLTSITRLGDDRHQANIRAALALPGISGIQTSTSKAARTYIITGADVAVVARARDLLYLELVQEVMAIPAPHWSHFTRNNSAVLKALQTRFNVTAHPEKAGDGHNPVRLKGLNVDIRLAMAHITKELEVAREQAAQETERKALRVEAERATKEQARAKAKAEKAAQKMEKQAEAVRNKALLAEQAARQERERAEAAARLEAIRRTEEAARQERARIESVRQESLRLKAPCLATAAATTSSFSLIVEVPIALYDRVGHVQHEANLQAARTVPGVSSVDMTGGGSTTMNYALRGSCRMALETGRDIILAASKLSLHVDLSMVMLKKFTENRYHLMNSIRKDCNVVITPQKGGTQGPKGRRLFVVGTRENVLAASGRIHDAIGRVVGGLHSSGVVDSQAGAAVVGSTITGHLNGPSAPDAGPSNVLIGFHSGSAISAGLQDCQSSVSGWTTVAQSQSKITGGDCIICQEKPSTTSFVPCGHVYFCLPCAEKAFLAKKECPACRGVSIMVMRTFSNA